MQNFVQTGDVLDLDPGVDVPAGVGHLFGSVFGVAAVDAVGGMPSSFVVAGVVAIAKTSALAVDVGDALYWDATAREVNKTTTDQQQVGIAIAEAANPSATVQMLMRGAPTAPGGASAFVDLTDAPATITPNAVLAGNDDGTAIVNSSLTYTVDNDGGRNLLLAADTANWSQFGAQDAGGFVQAQGYLDDTQAQLWVQGRNGSSLAMNAYADGIVEFSKQANVSFRMAGFDVTATDATATMTVDGVEYSIAKAIQVRIGTDTYFWPLFGPVAP